ncbi:hypothetical protein [Phormidesmis sp. 146-33]
MPLPQASSIALHLNSDRALMVDLVVRSLYHFSKRRSLNDLVRFLRSCALR